MITTHADASRRLRRRPPVVARAEGPSRSSRSRCRRAASAGSRTSSSAPTTCTRTTTTGRTRTSAASKPSEVWREHMITCFIDDPIGVQNRHAVGIDTITWECDYPHSDTTWPHSPEILMEQPRRRSRRRDQQDHARERAALLPARRVQAPRRGEVHGGGAARRVARRRPVDEERARRQAADRGRALRPVTTADVMKQLAGAFASRSRARRRRSPKSPTVR